VSLTSSFAPVKMRCGWTTSKVVTHLPTGPVNITCERVERSAPMT
jgi:hypothetical protein